MSRWMLTYCVSRRYWRKIVARSTQSRETCFQVPRRHTLCLLAARFKSISCADIPGETAGDNLVTIMSSLERIIVFAVQLTQLDCMLARLKLKFLVPRNANKRVPGRRAGTSSTRQQLRSNLPAPSRPLLQPQDCGCQVFRCPIWVICQEKMIVFGIKLIQIKFLKNNCVIFVGYALRYFWEIYPKRVEIILYSFPLTKDLINSGEEGLSW